MKRIGEKLKSQRGASILLALLFFLLCAMVGASVLMAAASNAGRSRSSREEQQKYLTLSSALQLVCDELTAAEYTAKYTYKRETINVPETTDEAGNKKAGYSYTKHTYEQYVGEYTGKLSQGGNCALPLLKELDWLFAKDFTGPTVSEPDQLILTPLSDTAITEPGTEHKLTLTVQEQTDKPGLATPVTVTVTLGKGSTEKYRLSLKATLGSEADSVYTMYAQLDIKGGASAAPKITEGQSGCGTAITWELKQITREEAK